MESGTPSSEGAERVASGTLSNESAERVALEEFRALQRIISHHQDLAFRLKAWYAAVLGAISYGAYFGHLPLSKWAFAYVGFIITFGFVYWLAFHRDVVYLSIRRSASIEKALREGITQTSYDGPQIAVSLSGQSDQNHGIERSKIGRRLSLFSRDEQVYIPWIIAVTVVIILTIFIPDSPNQSTSPNQFTSPSQPGSPSQPITKSQTLEATPDPAIAGLSVVQTATSYSVLAGSAVAIVLILGGLVAVLAINNAWVRAIGAFSILAGTGLHLLSVKDTKIDSIFKAAGPLLELSHRPASNIYIDRIALENNITDALIKILGATQKDASRFSIQLVGEFKKYKVGSETLASAENGTMELEKVCHEISRDKGRVYLVIGSTDRLPLQGSARVQYDANVGLAMARAKNVISELGKNCKESADNILLPLVSGPTETDPVRGIAALDPSGNPGDRHVNIYMLSIVSATAQSTDALEKSSGENPIGVRQIRR